jgi:hypothetical protein
MQQQARVIILLATTQKLQAVTGAEPPYLQQHKSNNNCDSSNCVSAGGDRVLRCSGLHCCVSLQRAATDVGMAIMWSSELYTSVSQPLSCQ